ncbi:hypothetical protein BN2475_120180 [Paraburkholderia ribeironis]|uniref:Uncharacterized protein n=1 Tax=Paraburkholderia ribeironis TaxID=1247936 RepID=A0A1N7RRG6_9BURK|nr:hypothetical protein BN2475_120180 [Paraburkholderia ribeironis]
MPKVWTDRDGNARPALDMVAHAALSAYHVQRRRKAVQAASTATRAAGLYDDPLQRGGRGERGRSEGPRVLSGPSGQRAIAHRDFPVATELQKLSEVENVRTLEQQRPEFICALSAAEQSINSFLPGSLEHGQARARVTRLLAALRLIKGWLGATKKNHDLGELLIEIFKERVTRAEWERTGRRHDAQERASACDAPHDPRTAV